MLGAERRRRGAGPAGGRAVGEGALVGGAEGQGRGGGVGAGGG